LLTSDFAAHFCETRRVSGKVVVAERDLENPLAGVRFIPDQVALSPQPAPEKLADLEGAAGSILDVISSLHQVPLSKSLIWITK